MSGIKDFIKFMALYLGVYIPILLLALAFAFFTGIDTNKVSSFIPIFAFIWIANLLVDYILRKDRLRERGIRALVSKIACFIVFYTLLAGLLSWLVSKLGFNLDHSIPQAVVGFICYIVASGIAAVLYEALYPLKVIQLEDITDAE
jgi:hypothetical protein